MNNILDKWLNSIESSEPDDQISILIFIANLTQDCLQPLEIEVVSKICSTIYSKLYKTDFTIFQQFLTDRDVTVKSFKFSIRNMSLWRAIWINSLKNVQILPSKTKVLLENGYKELLLWCIDCILWNINILDQNSLYLLRILYLILHRTDILSTSVSLEILNCMSKVSLSPLAGFRQLSESISGEVMIHLGTTSLDRFCDINLLPIKGIGTLDVIEIFTNDFVKGNIEKIVKKVLMMFTNNIENKDAGFLYEKLLICTFDEWVDKVWPHFSPKLQHIEYEGEFFQSLVKYWVPFTIIAYRTDFYLFIKDEPIDIHLKVQVILESRRKGFQLDQDYDIFSNIETMNTGLKIISTYRKKSLCPENEDINFFMDFLYSNLKIYLEDEELDSIKKFLSQMFFCAHTSLKRSEDDVNIFVDFIQNIYKYCYNSFKTDFYQVGGQVVHAILNILKGSHKDLHLNYKLEKRDYYETEENLLYILLKKKNLWKLDDVMYKQIRTCFLQRKCCSLILTDLLDRHYRQYIPMDINIIKNIIQEVGDAPNLQNTEIIINCSNLLFGHEKNQEIVNFVEEIRDLLVEKVQNKNLNDKEVFKNVLYLEILTSAKRRSFFITDIGEIMNYSFEYIDFILEGDYIRRINYRCIKVLETFITRVMYFISTNMKEIWSLINRNLAVTTLIKIIQKSNMKKPVSVSTDILRQFGFKMEESEDDKIFKIHLLIDTLDAIKETSITNVMKIRRSPESRLVIHAMCISQKDPDKPMLHWTMDYLLRLITYPDSTDLSISASLHTIELLICDNRLQNQTLRYIPDIIIQCVELFRRENWVVRNADLQLAKSLIERLYGVSMDNSYRPKSISDVFVLYPHLASYFFKILSLDCLDERTVIILQYFSESQIRENSFNDDISEILEYFRIIFIDIIKNYENHYGKLAVKAYVSLCLPKNVPKTFLDIETYIIINFNNFSRNIFGNLFLLMQELYDKYKKSYENLINDKSLHTLQNSWRNLLNFLRNINSDLLDLLLIKVKTVGEILIEKNFKNNLWVHNNLTFLFLNANGDQICEILEDENVHQIPEYFQIKMLSIVIQRYENNEFDKKDLLSITNSLIHAALSANENTYLLNVYFKVLLIFQEYIDIKFNIDVKLSENVYKNILNLLYIANSSLAPSELFYNEVLTVFINTITINEDVDNDILTILTICYMKFPKNCLLNVLKIVFYLSLFKSTHLEAFSFICIILNKKYLNLLEALNDFLSTNVLLALLKDETLVKTFLKDVIRFVDSNDNYLNCEGEFYTVESDVLIPKSFLRKLLKCRSCKNISNKCF